MEAASLFFSPSDFAPSLTSMRHLFEGRALADAVARRSRAQASIDAFVTAMQAHGIACGAIQDQGWGRVSQVTLPGGGTVGVYQPRHARPAPMPAV